MTETPPSRPSSNETDVSESDQGAALTSDPLDPPLPPEPLPTVPIAGAPNLRTLAPPRPELESVAPEQFLPSSSARAQAMSVPNYPVSTSPEPTTPDAGHDDVTTEHAHRQVDPQPPGQVQLDSGRLQPSRLPGARRISESYPGQLVLADGSVFEGDLIGAYPANGIASGEVVFNTAMSGYQEVITDPSYAGQIITFTYPHIGNYGVNNIDAESRGAFCRGIVVRDLARRPSNYRATEHLESLLQRHSIPGIAGLDTRRLTKLLRENGSMAGAFGDVGEAQLHTAAQTEPGTDGIDLVAQVTTRHPYMIEAAGGPSNRLIVAYDFGIKTMILRQLARLGRVQVVPASTPAADVLALSPDGVFLSNGPGDPRHVAGAIDQIGALIGNVPIFGICLGHQLIALAAGADVIKMPFGHHGANHPVQHVSTKEVEITSQNHNFAVDAASFENANLDVSLTHINLNDGVCEGLAIADRACFSVQHHPEAGPGPHDSNYLFGQFATLMDSRRSTSTNATKGGF